MQRCTAFVWKAMPVGAMGVLDNVARARRTRVSGRQARGGAWPRCRQRREAGLAVIARVASETAVVDAIAVVMV